jgi:hypothetical protein
MGFLYPSTQRHYRRIILLLKLLHVLIVRPSSDRNILLARITQLTTDHYNVDCILKTTDPDPLLLRNSGSAGNRSRTSGAVATSRNVAGSRPDELN